MFPPISAVLVILVAVCLMRLLQGRESSANKSYPQDALETYLHYDERLRGGTLFSWSGNVPKHGLGVMPG
jgi:hypothetical protein